MAKSLRSKWKRKMRSVKRVRYGEKEKARLVKMLENYEKDEKDKEKSAEEQVMEHEPQVLGSAQSTADSSSAMETNAKDDDATKKKYSNKSFKNQFGSYPSWMSNRRIQQEKGKKKKSAKKTEGKINKKQNRFR